MRVSNSFSSWYVESGFHLAELRIVPLRPMNDNDEVRIQSSKVRNQILMLSGNDAHCHGLLSTPSSSVQVVGSDSGWSQSPLSSMSEATHPCLEVQDRA